MKQIKYIETFAREMILLPGKAKKRAKREFTVVNDRLSTFLTQHGSKMAFVQRSHIILLALVAVYPATVAAMTAMVPGGQATAIINTVESQFGLSGTVTGYYPSQALIEVDGIRYTLRSEGLAKDVDLSTGSQIRYNLEKSSAEQRGRVTRIWIEAEE